MRSDRLDLALLLLLGLLWGSAFIAIRYVLDAGASPFLFVLVRLAASAPLVALLALASREPLPPRRELLLSALLGGALVMGGYQLLLFWGEQYTSGGLAGVLVAASPLFTALLSFALLRHEAFGALGLVGLALGFGGVTLLFAPAIEGGSGSTGLGLLAVLAAALAFALGSVLLRRLSPSGETLWGLSAEFAAGSLLAVPVLLLLEPAPHLATGGLALLATAYLVGVAGVLGFVIYFALHRRVGPGRANLVSFVSPVAALGLGGLLLGERYAPIEIVGFLLIVLGLFLLQRERLVRATREAGA